MSSLKVGAAKINIDPTPEMMPFPGGFTGLGIGLTHMEGIFSSCHTRAYVIDNGVTQAAIVGFDLAGPPRPVELRAAIEEETGIPPAKSCSPRFITIPVAGSFTRMIRTIRRKAPFTKIWSSAQQFSA